MSSTPSTIRQITRRYNKAMAFVPLPNGCKVAVEMLLQGQNAVNTFHFINAGAWDIDDMELLGEEVWDAYAAWVAAKYTSGTQLVRVTVTDLRTQFADQYVTTHSPVSGAVSSAPIPNNVAAAISRRSNLTGRSTRGRVYLPVENTANTSAANNMATAFRDGALALLDGIGSAAAAINFTEVIASYVQNGVPLTTAAFYVVLSRLVVNLTLDSMRGRLPGRGD